MGDIFIRFGQFLRVERPLLVLLALATIAVCVKEYQQKPRRISHFPKSTSLKHRQSIDSRPTLAPRYFREWRQSFLTTSAPYDDDGLYRGIFLGEDSAISQSTVELFREAGLQHVLAASGFNCWITAFAFGLIGRLLVLWFTPCTSSNTWLLCRSSLDPLAALCGAWLFWLWSDQAPPITRCVVLVSLKFALDLFKFRVKFERLLLVQYLVFLTLKPALWRNASFQLSYGCLFGIILLPRLLRFLEPRHNTYRRIAWNYAIPALGACLGVLPTTWSTFGEINFTSVLTNWLAVPPVTFLIMPLGITHMLLLPFQNLPLIPEIIAAIAWLAGLGVGFIREALSVWMEWVPSLRYTS